jgi:hypothetical protein
MCFDLFLFVTCFGWNFNPIAAAAAALGYMAAATAALGVFFKSFHYSTCLSSVFPYHFTFQLTFIRNNKTDIKKMKKKKKKKVK